MTSFSFPEFTLPLTPTNYPVQRSSAGSAASASRRILIIRTSANGDILMGTPLLAAIRRSIPDAHITWMVERRDREAIDANPHVDEILLWDTKYWKRLTRSGLYPIWAVLALRLRRLILQRRFDTLISFQPEDWPTLTRILGKAARIGVFDTFREYHGQTRTSRRARLFSHPFVYEEHPPHRVDQYLLPLKALGLPEPTADQKRLIMGFTEDDLQAAQEYIRKELKGQPFVVVAPLTGWPSRVWPAERFAAVSDMISERTGHKVVLVSGGGEKDRAVIRDITSRMRHQPSLAVGTFGFRALSALISKAALVLSGDTGPMHIASAFDTPYVALFGPSPVERFAPIVGRGLPMARSVPCGPCHQFECPNQGDDHQLCLKLLTVDDVFAAAASFLGAGGGVCAFPGGYGAAAPSPSGIMS